MQIKWRTRLEIFLSVNTVVAPTVGSSSNSAAKSFFMATRGGPLLLGGLGATAVGEVSTLAVTYGVGRRADTRGRVFLVIGDEAVGATEVAGLLDVADRRTVVRVMTLLFSWLALDLKNMSEQV